MQMGYDAVRSSLKALAEVLRSQPGRKSVFWVTQGFPPSLFRGESAWSGTISALNDADIAVNTLDANGLGGPAPIWGPAAIQSITQLAEQTGGRAFYQRNDLDTALTEAVTESRSGYTLGFYLTDVDGGYHDLTVSVDRPGVQLSYRRVITPSTKQNPTDRRRRQICRKRCSTLRA
jgi:VWFA-related protein